MKLLALVVLIGAPLLPELAAQTFDCTYVSGSAIPGSYTCSVPYTTIGLQANGTLNCGDKPGGQLGDPVFNSSIPLGSVSASGVCGCPEYLCDLGWQFDCPPTFAVVVSGYSGTLWGYNMVLAGLCWQTGSTSGGSATCPGVTCSSTSCADVGCPNNGVCDFSSGICSGGDDGDGGGEGGCSLSSCQNDYDCGDGQGCIDNCCVEGQGDGNGDTDPTCADSCYAGTLEYGTINCIDLVCGDIMNSCATNCNADCTCADDEDPIVIDLTGDGYLMTNVQNGVKFDILDNGTPVQMAWPAAGDNVGFLALDRNGNGKIDNGSELFSNIAPQAPPDVAKNGFRALAVYDQPASGGNRDGWIDAKDAIYTKLVIWVDKNHNGVTDPGELMTLAQAGIKTISVAYKPNKWTDANGNQFRYSSNIVRTTGKTEEIYDVFLVTAKDPVSSKK